MFCAPAPPEELALPNMAPELEELSSPAAALGQKVLAVPATVKGSEELTLPNVAAEPEELSAPIRAGGAGCPHCSSRTGVLCPL